VKSELQGLERLGGGEGAGDGDEREVGAGEPAPGALDGPRQRAARRLGARLSSQEQRLGPDARALGLRRRGSLDNVVRSPDCAMSALLASVAMSAATSITPGSARSARAIASSATES